MEEVTELVSLEELFFFEELSLSRPFEDESLFFFRNIPPTTKNFNVEMDRKERGSQGKGTKQYARQSQVERR